MATSGIWEIDWPQCYYNLGWRILKFPALDQQRHMTWHHSSITISYRVCRRPYKSFVLFPASKDLAWTFQVCRFIHVNFVHPKPSLVLQGYCYLFAVFLLQWDNMPRGSSNFKMNFTLQVNDFNITTEFLCKKVTQLRENTTFDVVQQSYS